MQEIRVNSIDELATAARQFRDWLLSDEHDGYWTPVSTNCGAWRRWVVSWIVYESLCRERWEEAWFQQGMQAFALLALERESLIKCFRTSSDQIVVCEGGNTRSIALEDFLNGESLSIRHDPEFADLSWTPTEAAGHLLSELTPDDR